MKYQRKAFTMIELIFVIVILGILSSVAISKMAVTRDDAVLAKGRAQVAGIRNAIVLMRNTNMLQAMGAKWPSALDDATTAVGQELFDGNDTLGTLLDYPLYAKNSSGNWMKTATGYNFKVMNTDVPFVYGGSSGVTVDAKTYKAGQFDCNHNDPDANKQKYCKALTE